MVGSGQTEFVLETLVAGALESSSHGRSGSLGYGASGMVSEIVAEVVAEYIPEPIARLMGLRGCSGEDRVAASSSTETALTTLSFTRTSTN